MDYTDDKNYGLKDNYPPNQYEQPRRPTSDDAASQNTRYNQPRDNQRRRNPISRALGAFFGGIWRIIKCIFFGFSILGNLVILLIIMAIIAVGYSGYKGGSSFGSLRTAAAGRNFNEYVITKGAVHQRIAVVEVANIITVETAEIVRQQLDIILEDTTVKAVIIRIQSPGGTVVASDQIHHLIGRLREKKAIPIVAYMAGLAASGGYYAAVACDRIIAEPTTITGSIGVVMQTFTMKPLFEEKLGIIPVTVKSGERKDWPNAFKDITPEQLDYIDQKLIRPAYQRFVELVDNGRKHLSLEQVKTLSDGSIYYAQEAKENGLIDHVGYFENAVKIVSDMAGITSPQVFGYNKIFGWADFMQMKASSADFMTAGKDFVSDMQSPKLLYIWQID